MIVTFEKAGERFAEELPAKTNLVVRAGIRKFPWPHLRYGCGMGKCGKCACRVLAGAETLPAPNWQEERVLVGRLDEGLRLACQLWPEQNLTLTQDDVQVAPPRP